MAVEHPGAEVAGPLAPYAAGFSGELVAQGYAVSSVITQINLMAQLSRWLDDQGTDAGGLTPAMVDRFAAVMRATRSVLVSKRALGPLLAYLRARGAAPSVPHVSGAVRDELLWAYRVYLAGERGLAEGTIRRHLKVAEAFLARLGEPVGDALRDLSAATVLSIVSGQVAPPVGVPTARYVAGSTRSLLGFLFTTGRVVRELAPVVPSVARRSPAGIPRRLAPAAVAALLGVCDRGTPNGRRDYAIILMIARLGLRSGDMAALTLDDLDWRCGEITVHGKGRRDDKLPLPCDVGEAVADYLRTRRPGDECRALFVSAYAPVRPLSLSGVGQVVKEACTRAGIPACGPRLLRQTLACDLLAAGAGLNEIAHVLRHWNIATTAIYAKADHNALATLVRPWPLPEQEPQP